MPFYNVKCNLCSNRETFHQVNSPEEAEAQHRSYKQHVAAQKEFDAKFPPKTSERADEFTHGKDHNA